MRVLAALTGIFFLTVVALTAYRSIRSQRRPTSVAPQEA
jgi:hypothetical protein